MSDLQKLLKISPDKVKAVNSVFLDADSQVMKNFFDVVAKYGTPQEINRKHRAARKMDHLFKIVQERNPDAIKDLNWLIEQRDQGTFTSVADYRHKVLGEAANKMKFKDKYVSRSKSRLCNISHGFARWPRKPLPIRRLSPDASSPSGT